MKGSFARPLCILLPLIFCVIGVYASNSSLQHFCENGSDYELIALAVEDAKSLDAVSGAYSRFHFRHPGPIFFYYYALMESLLWFVDSPGGSHRLAQFLLNCALLGVALFLCTECLPTKESRSRAVPIILFFMAIFVFSTVTRPFVLFDIWNPRVTLAPMLVFILASALVIQGRIRWIALQCGVGALLVQSHLGTIPVVFGVGGISTLTGIINAVRSRRYTRAQVLNALLLGAGIALILSLPALSALTEPGKGNIAALFAYIQQGSSTRSLGEALEYVAYFFNKPLRSVVRLNAYVVFAALLIIPWLPGFRDRSSAPLRTILIASLLISLLATTRIEGQAYRHVMNYQFALVALWYVLAIVGVLRFVTGQLPASSQWMSVALVLVTVIGAGISAYKLAFRVPPNCSRKETLDRYLEALAPRSDRLYKLSHGNHEAWPFIGGIALQLARQGIDFCVDQQWWFLYGERRTCAYRSREFEQTRIEKIRFIKQKKPRELSLAQSFQSGPNLMIWSKDNRYASGTES